MANSIYFGDNLAVLQTIPEASVDLLYIDPPFNTGRVQGRTQLTTVRDENGDRVGFKGQSYRTIRGQERGYQDTFDDYLGFLGSLYFHIDYREVHYCKILLDEIFGRDSFLNEIIWAYDFGGRSKDRWPAKHDNILYYAKDPKSYTFNRDAVDRIPYMAPGLVGKEKEERGKFPTDTWWHTIVGTNSKEKTGYPTQKPVGVLRRIILASSNAGDTVMDFFAGSGTVGAVCLELGRKFILVDNNPQAIEVMKQRFTWMDEVEWR
jgi:site-specific DNA-methyltransferase (adenine-specific)